MASFTETIAGVDVGITHADINDLVNEQEAHMRNRLVTAAYELRDRQGFINQTTLDSLKPYTNALDREVAGFKEIVDSKTRAGEAMLKKRGNDRRAIPSNEDRLKTAGYFGSRVVSRFFTAQEAAVHQELKEKILSHIFRKYDEKKKYQAASHVPEDAVHEGVSMYTPPSHLGDLALLPIVSSCSETSDEIMSSFDAYGCGKEEGEATEVLATMSAMEEDVNAFSLAKLVEIGTLPSTEPLIMNITLGRYKLIVGPHSKLESLRAYEIEEADARTALEELAQSPNPIPVEVNYLGGFSNAIDKKRTIIVGQFTVKMTNSRNVDIPVRIVAKFVSYDKRPLSVLVEDSLVVDNHGNIVDSDLKAGADPFVITVKGSVSSTELHATGERMPLSESEYTALRVDRSPDDTRGAPFVRYVETGSIVADDECKIASNFDPYTNVSWRVAEEAFKDSNLRLNPTLGPYVYNNNLDLGARHRLKSTSCCRTNIDLEDIPMTHHMIGVDPVAHQIVTNSRNRVFSAFIQLTLRHTNSPLLNRDGFVDPTVAKMLMKKLLDISDELFLDGNREVFSVGPRSAMRRIVSGSVLQDVTPNFDSNIRTFTTEDCLYRLIVSLVTRQDTTVNSRAFPLVATSQVVSRYFNIPLCTFYRNPLDPTNGKSGIAVYTASANIVDNLFDRLDLNNLLNSYRSAHDYIVAARNSGHKALAGYPSISEPFARINSGFSQDAGNSRVTVSIGKTALSCDCLIADCLRAIMRKIRTSRKIIPERVFVFYHDKIAILFCLPNNVLDAGNRAKIFINFSPRPSRMTRLIKSSTNIAVSDGRGITLNQALYGRGGVMLDGYFEKLPG